MNNQNYNNNANPPGSNDPYQQQQMYQAWPQQYNYGYGYYQQPPVQNFYQPPQQQPPPTLPNFAAPPPPPPSQPNTSNPQPHSQNQEGHWQNDNHQQNQFQNRGGGYQNNRGGGRGRGDNTRSQNQFRGNHNNNSNSRGGGGQGIQGNRGGNNNNKNNRGGGNSNNRNQNQQFHALPPSNTGSSGSNNNEMFSRNEQASTSTASNDIFSTASAMFGNQSDKFIDEQDAAFMKQFEEWEAGFAKWREENKNHPDKAQYLKYEDQFISVRTQLLARRNEMLRRKQKQAPAPKTAEQMKFESQWNAGDPQASQQNSNTFTMDSNVAPNILEVQVPPSNISMSNDAAVAPLLFGSSTFEKDFKNDSFDNFGSFDDGESSSSSLRDRVFSRVTSIPGLDVQEPPTPRYSARDDVIDLDYNDDNATAETNEMQNYQSVLPSFTPKRGRNLTSIINIGDILDDPGRLSRPDRILLIIRGASGSGKSHLANLIFKKEAENKNERCRIVEPRGRGFQAIFGECMDLMREGYINFIIVLFEKATILQLNEISNAAIKTGNYHPYSIEIHQKLEVCMRNSKKTINEIKSAIDILEQNVTPPKILMLDPSSLYAQQIISEENETPHEQENTLASKDSSSSLSLPSDYLSKILQEGNVFELVKSQMTATTSTLSAPPAMPNTYVSSNSMQNNSFNNQRNFNTNNFQGNNFQNPPPSFQSQQINNFQAPPPFTNNFQPQTQFQGPPPFNNDPVNASASEIDDCPEFVPKKTIEYNHTHMMTFEEQLLEFKVFRVINYQHRQSIEIRETLKHIDIDKIIEKRKNVAQRKKILEYLRSAERPEDTVSNPLYPKNWEVIEQERPPRRNKRKKAMTAKIKRVLFELNRNVVKPMELEEISSESDDGFGSATPVKNKSSNSQIFDALSDDENEMKQTKIDIFKDEFSHITERTIPDFNHFNHKKWIDIKEILWFPGRRRRPHKILIILRGVSGSGKSHLVQLIKRKESEEGKASDIRILSIDDYILAHDDDEEEKVSEMGDKEINSYLDRMLKLLEKTLKDGFHSFIIIDAENCNLDFYDKFYNVGSSMGCTVYTIELYQKLEICKQQCCRNVSPTQMTESMRLMDTKRIPSSHTLLIPTALYNDYKCFVNPKLKQDDEEDDFRGNLDALPSFNWHNRSTRSLNEILEGQMRFRRPRYIAILMRGPDTFNKMLLSNMIVAKEKEMRNENINFINVEDLFINQLTGKFEMVPQRHYDDNMRKITRKLRDIAQRKSIKFLIINTETGDFDHYLQIYNLMTSYDYRCYTIEVYRSPDKCSTDDPYERSTRQLETISEDFQLNATPDDHELLDATKFFKKNLPPEAKTPVDNVKKDQPEKEEEIKSQPTSSQAKTISLGKVKKCDQRRTFASTQEEFQALFQTRFMVNGEFVLQNIKLPVKLPEFNWYNKDAIDIREFFENSSNRPQKIAIFIRGAPGSGKSYLANLIARKEIECGNRDNLKILSVDKYFETEKYREVEHSKYEKYIECSLNEAELDSHMEELSRELETFVSELDDENKHSMIIIDGDFCELKFYNRMWSIATIEGGFSGYTIELNQDDSICLSCNVHGWSKDLLLAKNNQMKEISTPDDHKLLDPEYLYDLYHYTSNEHGDTFEISEDVSDDEDSDLEFSTINKVTSKWESLDTDKFERMDGTKNKVLRHQTMEEYLNMSEWTMRPSAATGKKRVRWADIEEKKAQERARDVGFIVGQTNWNRMLDNTDGRSALEKTKYIEPRRKN